MSTEILELLRPFCSTDRSRARFNAPIASACRSWTLATDGRILVRVPHCGGAAEEQLLTPGALVTVLGDFPVPVVFGPVPDVPAPLYSPCTRCEGTGKRFFKECPCCSGRGDMALQGDDGSQHRVECPECAGKGHRPGTASYHTFGEECSHCGGQGKIRGIAVTKVGETYVQNYYLRLIAALPGAELEVAPAKEAKAHFRFAGGIGVVMPVRNPEVTS